MSATCDRSVIFFLGTPISSTNKTDSHVITEILLKVVLNTISHQLTTDMYIFGTCFVNYKKECTRLAAASDKVYQFACPWSVVLSWYSGFFHP
jgi:hypothetical protein